MTLFNNIINLTFCTWCSFLDVRSNWFNQSYLFKIRMMLDHLNISHWDDFTHISFSFSFESLKIHFLETISMSIRNFPKFWILFFVSKRVLSVFVWDFIWLIIFDRSIVKWWQLYNKCFEIWLKLQFSFYNSTVWRDKI